MWRCSLWSLLALDMSALSLSLIIALTIPNFVMIPSSMNWITCEADLRSGTARVTMNLEAYCCDEVLVLVRCVDRLYLVDGQSMEGHSRRFPLVEYSWLQSTCMIVLLTCATFSDILCNVLVHILWVIFLQLVFRSHGISVAYIIRVTLHQGVLKWFGQHNVVDWVHQHGVDDLVTSWLTTW